MNITDGRILHLSMQTQMKHHITIWIIITFAVLAQATTSPAVEAYIIKYEQLAIGGMKQSGIPASILLAQAILHSQHGTSKLSTVKNNHFDVQCGNNWIVNSDSFIQLNVEELATCFRAYLSAEDCYEDYISIIMESPGCRFLFQYSYSDYKSWSSGIEKALYPHDTKYAATLVKVIEKYELQRYDTPTTFSPIVNEPIIGYEYEIN